MAVDRMPITAGLTAGFALDRLAKQARKTKTEIKTRLFLDSSFSRNIPISLWECACRTHLENNKPRDAECVSLPRLAAITEERV
jgi:hypothetical protein